MKILAHFFRLHEEITKTNLNSMDCPEIIDVRTFPVPKFLEVEDRPDVLDPLLPSLGLGLTEGAGNEVALLVLDSQHPLLDAGNKNDR